MRNKSDRMSRKELDGIKKSYHMDLERIGCTRIDEENEVAYSCNIMVEKLVEEIEACWKEIESC